MSDYYGDATLEDWLAEEVFSVSDVPPDVVALFEQWRDGVEGQINSWLKSDDGHGNRLSWRGWGRGYHGIPDRDIHAFEQAIAKGSSMMVKP